jgi:hypothetical protein
MKMDAYTDRDFEMRWRFFEQTISFWQQRKQKDARDSLGVKENVRNVNCKHYLTCLDTAALANARDLGCENCRFRMDNTYKMTIRDFTGLMQLYYEVRDPEVSEVIEKKKQIIK